MASADVTVTELDLSTRVPTFPGLYIGMVIPDPKKGNVNTATLCTNDTQFLNLFTPDGKVGIGYDNAYFSALAALQNSNKLWVVGASSLGMKWAGAYLTTQNSTDKNSTLTEGMDDPLATNMGSNSILVAASSPRAWANDIRIQVLNYKSIETIQFSGNEFTSKQKWGNGFPVTLSTTGKLPKPLDPRVTYFTVNTSDNKIALTKTAESAFSDTPEIIELDSTDATGEIILKAAQEFTKIPDTFLIRVFKKNNLNHPLETFTVSKTQGAKDGYGKNIYVNFAAISSNYIQLIDNPAVTDALVKDQVNPIALGGGLDGMASTDADCIEALNELSNIQSYPITLIIDSGRATVNYHKAIVDLAESRMDCIGILSTPFEIEESSNYLNAVVDYKMLQLNVSSSYAAMYSSHVKIYDKFNDRDIYISPDGFVAGLISKTAANFDMWWPVAGFRRGVMNVKDVRRRWTKGEMDYLYDNNINPIRFAVGKGIVIWGQKNLYAQESTLNRVNVRLLIIAIETMLKESLENYLFEINDDETRLEVTSMINAGMDQYKTRRGIYSYKTICDDTNNTQDNMNQLNVTLMIKPSQAVEDIRLTVAIPRNTSDFTIAVNSNN